jgi:hypothetical protein
MSAAAIPFPNRKTAPPIELAAAENLTLEFFLILTALGLEVLIVRFQAGNDSPIWKHAGIERDLERELQSIQTGQFDSSFFPLGAQWHFFHVASADLGKAMQRVKDALDARGLLAVTTLYHAETAHELRVWYPATAELVNTDADTEA